MQIQVQAMPSTPRREPWNKGKLIGQKRRFGQTCIVDPYPIADGGTDARLGNV
jgi:hypothetical protein